MNRTAFLLIFVTVFPIAGCAAELAANPGALPTIGATATMPVPVVTQPEGAVMVASGPAYGPNDDRQWFQSDDFLIADQPYQSGYLYVKLAKMKQPPSPSTKNEALFFSLTESKDVWTSNFWRSRPAEQADLVIGAPIICFEGNAGEGGVYRAPRDKDNARTTVWFMSRVTDTSDLFKGAVGVDTYKCSPAALRVPTR
jgi:hypothetical protein